MSRRRRRHRDHWDMRGDGVHPEVERFIKHVNGYFDDLKGHGRYAHHVGDPGPGPNRHRIYRDVRGGKIAGVCAGLADYFGWRVKYVRIALVLLTLVSFPIPIFLYGAAAIFMPPGETIATRYDNPDEEHFWRNYSMRPKVTYSQLRHRFRAIEARIADMERAVTSNEYALRKEFRDLESGA
ncbi:MAG: envelope stress response membrane protein PspC [Parvularculaceae bacterium]|nr:envelope stress response membrane protein PspC [Parvularculaceae bacterium]